jgi:hypothetical protein
MKTLLPLLLLFLFISCSSDDRNDIVSTNIDYYVLESKFFEGQSMTSYEKRRYDVIDGKWFSTTYLTGSHSTFQTHFYSNGLLVTEHTNMDADYIYNGQQLIAMRYSNYGGSQQYRRFVPISATTYYVEVLTAAYDDPSTQITARFIVELDVFLVISGNQKNTIWYTNYNKQWRNQCHHNGKLETKKSNAP